MNEARRLRQLEAENGKLKLLLAESTLDNHALRDLLRKMHDACSATRGRAPRPGNGGTSASVARRTALEASWTLLLPHHRPSAGSADITACTEGLSVLACSPPCRGITNG